MSYRLGKVLLVAMIGVLTWMIVSAFAARPSPDISLERDETSAPLPTAPAEARAERMVPSSSTPPGPVSKAEHEAGHPLSSPANAAPSPASSVPFRKRTPVDPNQPLATDGHGRTVLNWDVLAATRFGPDSKPVFSPNLAAAEGKAVSLSGFMAPLDEAGDMHLFLLLEFPIGCFYCLVPDPAGIVLVELKGRQTEAMRYDLVTVTGQLRLNASDPEDFLYIVSGAELSSAE